jgi:hypothetical protein
MTPLPKTWTLITDTWNQFVKHWNTNVRYSAWYAIAVVAQTIVTATVGNNPSSAYFAPAFLFYVIVSMITSIWVGMVLMRVTLIQEHGGSVPPDVMRNAWSLLLPAVWIGILTTLANIGGFILLIIPGIYIAIRLSFTIYALVDKGRRGRAALKESWEITKGRFWALFGRGLAGGIVFGLFAMILAFAALLIVGLVAGGANIALLSDTGSSTGGGSLENAVSVLIQGIIQIALLPLFVTFQTKLYTAIQKHHT